MRHRRFGLLALPVVAFLLAGCAAPAPQAAPTRSPAATSSPSATAEPEPEPATAVIGAHGIVVVDGNGSTMHTMSYTDPAPQTLDVLTSVFESSPVVTHRDSDFNCVPAANLAVWDGFFTLIYDVEGWTPAGQSTFAYAIAPESANGVKLWTASGFGVGDSVEALVAAQPGVARESMEWEGTAYSWVHYDVGAGEYYPDTDPNWGVDPYWGASAVSVDGVITGLHAPVPYIDLC